MRGSFARTARQLSRNANRVNVTNHCLRSARWSSTESDGGHRWSTPLAKQLAEAITTTGPIPVASFMRQCLTSDLGGYYTNAGSPDRDQFGAKGDFVTSPEISQVFGELIGVWFVAEWIAQGKKSEGVYLMEVGPGRGTLMDDVLRTIRNFPALAEAIEAVYLVEASEGLRKAQHRLLCGDNPLTPNEIGFESTSKHSSELKVVWTENSRFVPRDGDKTPFIVAHEFFDALPIHIFQASKPKADEDVTIQTPTGPIKQARRLPKQNYWKEMLVSPKPPHRLKDGEPEFELSLSPSATAHSMYLPETSSRYTALKDTEGATIEVSPESQAYMQDFAVRLGGSNPSTPRKFPRAPTGAGKPVSSASPPSTESLPVTKEHPSGAALIIDYGPADTIPANSLRGIRAHERVSPFAAAGTVDLSADVDFLGLAEAALNASPGVEVHGPVDQARFLTAMGIEARAAQLIKRAMEKARQSGADDAERTALKDVVARVESEWKRLVDRSPQGMGRLYQVMAVLPHVPRKAPRRPVGFGGEVVM